MQRIRRQAASPQPRDYWLSIAGQARASQQKRTAQVMSDRCGRGHIIMYVRFAPESGQLTEHGGMSA
jgi:hypothetical protein